jgi:hypothetical protein
MANDEDIFRGLGIEIKLKTEDDFLKVRETLTRMGIISFAKKSLYQSCHILHKRGRYSIFHFKEMFVLDNRKSTLDETDIARRNTIANMLESWGLVEIIDKEKAKSPVCGPGEVRVISHKEKENWNLIAKYSIGRR